MEYSDLVLIDKSHELDKIIKKLGFDKLYYTEDINNLGIVEENDYDKKRNLIENNKIKILLNPHLLNIKDDLHYRSSGLDQVLCKLMNKNNIALGISLDALNNYVEIGRVMQNISLCRKYKVKILIFSFAKEIYQLRSRIDIESLLKVLKMDSRQIKEAFYF